jgi:ABC-2 type transport system permease protein
MAIIWRIARHELLAAWRSRAVTALAVALTLLTATAALVGDRRFVADEAIRARYQQMVVDQFEGQPDRHPHRVSHYGFLVFRPRAPIGFVDGGVEAYAGTSIFLEAHRQNTANFSAAVQDGGGIRFGELTLAQVLQLFVPLFIFALAGVSITREREAGTLALLLCQGVSWRRVLIGKIAGTLLIVALMLAPGMIATALWLAVREGTIWSADLAARGLLFGLSQVVFLFTCAAIAVITSARMQSSRAAILALVTIWVALWIVLPRLLPAVGNALYPVPSRAAFDADVERRVRELGDSHNPDDPKFAAIRAQALADNGVSRVEDLPFNYSGFLMQQAERLTSTAYEAHMSRLVDTYRRQARLVDFAGAISPFIAIRAVSTTLAGSDAEHLLDFDRQAEAYRYSLIQGLNELHISEVPASRDRYSGAGGAPSRLRIDRALFASLPDFSYRPPAIRWSLSQRRVGILFFLLSAAMVTGGVVWTSRRQPAL